MAGCPQIIAYGMVWPRHCGKGRAYLRDAWNVLDFAIVLLSVLSLSTGNSSLRAFKALRTTRALRPLRLLSKMNGMKQVKHAAIWPYPGGLYGRAGVPCPHPNPSLLHPSPVGAHRRASLTPGPGTCQQVLRSLGRVVAQSGAILVLLMLFWIIFAILGVELFSGKFHCCSDPTHMYMVGMAETWGGDPALECVGNFTDLTTGEVLPRVWESTLPNFDNIGQALLTLFEVTTLEDWDAVLQKV